MPATASHLSCRTLAAGAGAATSPGTVSTPPPWPRPHLSFEDFPRDLGRSACARPRQRRRHRIGSGGCALGCGQLPELGSANLIGDFISGALLMLRDVPESGAQRLGCAGAGPAQREGLSVAVSGSDPEGEKAHHTVKKAPQHGYVEIDDYGVYTYIPAADFTGNRQLHHCGRHAGFPRHQPLNVLNPLAAPKKVVKVAVNANAADPAGTVRRPSIGSGGFCSPTPRCGRSTPASGSTAARADVYELHRERTSGWAGQLVLEAHQAPDGYTRVRWITKGPSGMTYGTMTARIKFPAGQGMWPAFDARVDLFLMKTPGCVGAHGLAGAGEIDVMELINTGTTYHVAYTAHRPVTGPTTGSGEFVEFGRPHPRPHHRLPRLLGHPGARPDHHRRRRQQARDVHPDSLPADGVGVQTSRCTRS